MNFKNAGSVHFAHRDLGKARGTVKQPSLQRECPERAESTTANTAAFTPIRASVDSGMGVLRWKAIRDGINLQEESESEQQSKPYGGDHSSAIDHSVGSGRRRIGFLLGSCVSPPLALANAKHKTLVRCTTWRDCLVRPTRISQACAVPTVSTSCEAFSFAKVLNTYLARYYLVAFVSCFGIDSSKASMG